MAVSLKTAPTRGLLLLLAAVVLGPGAEGGAAEKGSRHLILAASSRELRPLLDLLCKRAGDGALAKQYAGISLLAQNSELVPRLSAPGNQADSIGDLFRLLKAVNPEIQDCRPGGARRKMGAARDLLMLDVTTRFSDKVNIAFELFRSDGTMPGSRKMKTVNVLGVNLASLEESDALVGCVGQSFWNVHSWLRRSCSRWGLDPSPPPRSAAEIWRAEMDELDSSLTDVSPDPGRERAPIGPPRWCNGTALDANNWSPLAIARRIHGWERQGWGALILAARLTCLWPRERPVQRAAAIVHQSWINLTGLGVNAAADSLAARLDEEKFLEGKKRICGALILSDETAGEDRAFMNARRMLLCESDGPLWSRPTPPPALWEGGYLDHSSVEPDQLVRLAWVLPLAETGDDRSASNFEKNLATYGVENIDYQLLSDRKLFALLDNGPYRGNRYVETIVKESLARARIGMAALASAVEERATDPDWKELLIDAPKKGADAYLARTSRYEPQIARSNDFERRAYGPSKKAVAGCLSVLRPDFVGVWKALPHRDEAEAHRSLSDPVAGLLFERLVLCMELDGDPMFADAIKKYRREFVRGVRVAALVAAREAAARIRANRERFPISPGDFSSLFRFSFGRPPWDTRPPSSSRPWVYSGGLKFNGEGVVKAASRRDNDRDIEGGGSTGYQGLRVEFGDGEAEPPILIPNEFAANIEKGCFVKFLMAHPKLRVALPLAVYKRGATGTLVNALGFEF